MWGPQAQRHRTRVQLILWIQSLELLMSEIGEIVSAIKKLGNGTIKKTKKKKDKKSPIN